MIIVDDDDDHDDDDDRERNDIDNDDDIDWPVGWLVVSISGGVFFSSDIGLPPIIALVSYWLLVIVIDHCCW